MKWGICCSGNIAHDFASALTEFGDTNHELIGIAARNIENAKYFAEKFLIPNFFDNYEKLAKFKDIEVVYVASINSEHLNLVKLFLNNNKHVLVEKPMGLNTKETEEMIHLAREKKLFLMEAIWSRTFPIYKRIDALLKDGSIGTIQHISANFHRKMASQFFAKAKQAGSKGLMNIGFYTIQFVLFMMSDHIITKCRSQLKYSNDIDLCGQIFLEFENGTTSFLSYAINFDGESSAEIYGDKGSIKIPNNFWCPEQIIINGCPDSKSYLLKRKNSEIKYNFPNSWGLIYEADHVAECIKENLIESNLVRHDESIKISQLMEQCLTQSMF